MRWNLFPQVQEWVCIVCNKRRQLMMTTGLWYHGYHGFQAEEDLPLARSLGQGDTTLTDPKPDTMAAPGMDTSMTSIASDRSAASSKDSRASRDSRDESDLGLEDPKRSGSGPRCGAGVSGGDSGLGLDLVTSISGLSAASSSNSELAKHVYEQNRMKGPGATLPKSESDEFSDLTSDLDFDELASERSRPDGGSSTDENAREGKTSHEGGSRRNKHRPRFLHLTRSHSHTSSDEEEDATQEEGAGKSEEESGKTGSGMEAKNVKNMAMAPNLNLLGLQQSGKSLSSSSSSSSSTSSSSASYTLQQTESAPNQANQPRESGGSKCIASEAPRDVANLQDSADGHAVNSPTPRSPSWREGLESPPFSPRRRDSYPGKRRGSLSPKEKKATHFTYSDISPPSRQLSLDELYGGQVSGSALDNGVAGSHAPQRPSPMSPQEIKDAAMMTTSGNTLVFDLPPVVRNGKHEHHQQQTGHSPSRQTGDGIATHVSVADHSMEHVPCGVPHSAPVMDLATFAATITSSTNTLTSLTAGSMSPSSRQNTTSSSSSTLSNSPEDSGDSSCSSPVSPGYYDNATPPSDEPEEAPELSDPAPKSIDMQGSKRQKARPPSTDWSPVIDLSPILDVSPSVEEAEQEDMLAKRMEELERQRSREVEEEEEEGEEAKIQQTKQMSGDLLPSKYRAKAGPLVTPLTLVDTELPEIPRIPPPPSAKKLKQQLNEELEEAGASQSSMESRRHHYEDEDDDDDDYEAEDGSSCFSYGSSLRRCGNFEDISRLTCDNSNILTSPLDHSATDDGLYGNDFGQDFSFPSCTSQAEAIGTVSTTSTNSIATFSSGSTSTSSSINSSISSEKDLEALEFSDQIQRITQDMENIVKKDEAVDVRPVPPPKPKRRLPDAEVSQSPPPAGSGAGDRRETAGVKSDDMKTVVTIKGISKAFDSAGTRHGGRDTVGKATVPSIVMEVSTDNGPSGSIQHKEDASETVPRQDSGDRKKAKDMKAKPSPLLITHIECEEQSVSPHYRVMESPPTPETKTVKREFSDSTSVSPSSTPDQDVYAFPSPVTPPDSDSSPPKPHSPSSPGTDYDDDDIDPAALAACRVFSPDDNSVQGKGSPQYHHKSEVRDVSKQHSPASTVQATRSSAGSPDVASVPIRPPISPRKSIRRQEESQYIEAGLHDAQNTQALQGMMDSPVYENIKGLTRHEYLQEQQKGIADVTSSAKGLDDLSATSLCAQYLGQRTQIFAYPALRDQTAGAARTSSEARDTQRPSQQSRNQRPEVPPRPRLSSTTEQQKKYHQQQQQQQQEQAQQQDAGKGTSIKDKIKAFEEVSESN
ncbi:tripartite motif-containing protein 45 [Plakobranchus ocellatus]|uniref:Tripartite motif-containing protein 45 n=1 Tax=Plakobranchus ocellatus TaxID=259542 RepID=A0AAV3Z2U0_9GAST|nr:tripartite motif-containing protein 45 [Plakobranchus ocellatus]